MITTAERARIQERRETTLWLLENKFGPLPAEVKQRVKALAPERLRQVLLDLLQAKSLDGLRLED